MGKTEVVWGFYTSTCTYMTKSVYAVDEVHVERVRPQ